LSSLLCKVTKSIKIYGFLPIPLTLAVLTVSTGQLPKVLKTARIAQLQLIKESQATKWGTPMMPSIIKSSSYRSN